MDIVDATSLGELVWEALVRVAYLATSESVVIPRRDGQSTSAVPWFRTIERHGRPYAVLNKEALISAMLTNWTRTVWDLCPILLYRSPKEWYRCPLESINMLTWILSALRASQIGYVLVFDTLQFSTYVDVSMQHGRPFPLEQGACAFVRTEEEHAVAVLWRDSSWSPIVAGFVMAPGAE